MESEIFGRRQQDFDVAAAFRAAAFAACAAAHADDLIANGRVAPEPDPEDPDEAYHAFAVRNAVEEVAYTTLGPSAVSWRQRQQEVDEGLDRLLVLVCAVRWSSIVPTAATLSAADPGVQVAWDLVADHARTNPRMDASTARDHTIPELIEAHARAARLGLDWSDPVQRAVAERATDEERIRQLLAAGSPEEPS